MAVRFLLSEEIRRQDNISHDTLQRGAASTWETVTRDSETAYTVRLEPSVETGLLTTS
jgi:hypothetical protein